VIAVVQYFELALLMAISIRPMVFQDVKQKKGKIFLHCMWLVL